MFTSQQSSPAPQQTDPQQKPVPTHVTLGSLQGAGPHFDPSQKGCSPSHSFPHAPQFKMSFAVLTHALSQHVNPGPQGHACPPPWPAPPWPAPPWPAPP
jgi:hypothetical protein